MADDPDLRGSRPGRPLRPADHHRVPREDDEHGLACSWAASHTALTWTTLSPEDQQEWLEAQPERLVGLLRAALRAYVETTGVDLAGRAARLRAEWKGWHSRE